MEKDALSKGRKKVPGCELLLFSGVLYVARKGAVGR